MRISEKISIKMISSITHKMIIGLMLFNLLAVISLPYIVRWILKTDIGTGYSYFMEIPSIYSYFLVILYLGGIMAFVVLNDLRLIFKSCCLENVFTRVNVNRLLRMAITMLLISLVFATKIFVVNSMMTMIIVFVFFMASVFCFVIALLFDQAVHYKEENDLTI